MELPTGTAKNPTISIATQTDKCNNLGQGRIPLMTKQQYKPFTDVDYDSSPDYLKNLYKVFGEKIIAKATKTNTQSKNLFHIIEKKDWDNLRHFSRYWHSLKRDLITTESSCILYDGKLFIPKQLRKLIMNSIHRNHPGQSGMMHLANLIWFSRIHREIVILNQNCPPCIKIGKNVKPIIPKNLTSKLPPLQEPNEEVQFDFVGTTIDKKIKKLLYPGLSR